MHIYDLTPVAKMQMHLQLVYDNNLVGYVHPEGICEAVLSELKAEDYCRVPCGCGCGSVHMVVKFTSFEREVTRLKRKRIQAQN